MFHRAVLLNLPVAAMVIGNQEPLVRDQFARTPAAEPHDSVFQASPVHGVEVLCREPQPFGPHIPDPSLANQTRQPHPLVGPHRQGNTESENQ